LIDYVIVHEICHLKVLAHNKAFYALVGSIMPDWKERRAQLNNRID
jgi:predicted metal-dependent hydrolase